MSPLNVRWAGPGRKLPPPVAKAIRIVLLFLLLAFALWRIQLGIQVRNQFSALKAAGLPASGQELDAWRDPVADSENAALILDEAFAALTNFAGPQLIQITEATDFDAYGSWDDESRRLVAEFVAMNTNALAIARSAVARPHCRYPADYAYGVEMELPHLSRLNLLADAAILHATLEMEAGRAGNAVDDVELILQLAGTLESEPLLLSYMSRGALIRRSVRAAERVLNLGPLDEPLIRRLAARLESAARPTNLFQRALIGERALMIPVFRFNLADIRRLSSDDPDQSPAERRPISGKANPFLWFTGMFERDLNYFLRAMATNISAAASPPPASFAHREVIGSMARTARKRYLFLSSIYLPTLEKTPLFEANYQAHVAVAGAALAVEQYRASNGRLPDTLNQLAPQFLDAVPKDPFDGEALRYRRLEKGYVVYSVGENRKDDGGQAPPSDARRREEAPYDLTFAVDR